MDSQIFTRISKLSEQRRMILEKETGWKVFHHIDGEEIEKEMTVGPEVITVKEQQQITVRMKDIKEIYLWNGKEGYQDLDELPNTCFSILHFDGTKWETLGFELDTPEERIDLVMDIIDKLQLLGVYAEKGLTPQIVVDSMGLDESLEIPFDNGELHFEEHHLKFVKKEPPIRVSQIEKQNAQRLRLERLNEKPEVMEDSSVVKKEIVKRVINKNEETQRNKAHQREMARSEAPMTKKTGVGGSGKPSDKMKENENLKKKMGTVWKVWHHINDEEIEKKMIVGPEVITVKGKRQMTVHLIQILEIDLWNGLEGYQDLDELQNTCFAIVHYNGTDWETLGFELDTPEERITLVMDIIDKLQSLGVYPAQGLSRQIVLDSMGLDESLEVPFDNDDIPMYDLEIVKEEHPVRVSQVVKADAQRLRSEKLKAMEESSMMNEGIINQLNNKIESMGRAESGELKRFRAENKEIREQLKSMEEANMTNQGTVWPVFHHIDGQEIEKEMTVGSEIITVQQRLMTVHMIQIKEIDLWNGVEGYQDLDELKNTCFAILHYNGTEWETLGFEMNTPEERVTLVMDIIDKLQSFGVYPAQGLSRQIVLDSMGLDESLEIPLDNDDIPMHNLKIVSEEHPMRPSEKELEEKRKQNEKLSENLDQLINKIESMKKAESEELTRLRAKNKEIREQLDSVEKERANDEDKLQLKTKRITAIEEANMTQLEAQRMQNEKLSEDLDQQREEMKKMRDEQAVMIKAKRQLEKELIKQTKRKKALEGGLKDVQQQLQEMQAKVEKGNDDSKQKLSAEMEKNEKLQTKMDLYRKETDEATAQKERYQLELERMDKRLGDEKRKRDTLQEEISNLDQKVFDQQRKTNKIREEKEQLNRELNDKNKGNDNLMKQMEQLRSELHQQKVENEQLQRLKSEVVDSRRERSDRQMEMEKAQQELVMKHKESIEMKDKAISKIEEKNKKLEALIDTKAAAIELLKSDLLAMEKMNRQNSQLTEANTREQIVKEQPCPHLESMKRAENEELTRLRAENKEIRKQRANDLEKLRVKNEEKLLSENEGLKLRLQQTVEQHEQERKAFDEKVKGLHTELEKLNLMLILDTHNDAHIGQQNPNYERDVNVITELQKQIDAQKLESEELIEKLKAMEEANLMNQGTIEELESKIEAIKSAENKELVRMKQNVHQIQERWSSAQEERQHAEETLRVKIEGSSAMERGANGELLSEINERLKQHIQQTVEQHEQERNALDERLKELRTELEGVKEEKSKLETQHNAHIDAQRLESEELIEKLKAMKEANMTNQETIEELERKIEGMESAMLMKETTSGDESAKLRHKMKNLKKEMDNLRQQYSAKIKRLQSIINELRAEQLANTIERTEVTEQMANTMQKYLQMKRKVDAKSRVKRVSRSRSRRKR